MRVIYLPLEPYEERYTTQLRQWTIDRLADQCDLVTIDGDVLAGGGINVGVALDAHGRSHWALTQTARLIAYLKGNPLTSDDAIYNQDLFHPGWEAVPYLFDQLPAAQRPRTFTHLLAQTIDPNDFTFKMRQWMRPYEMMIDRSITGVMVASECMVPMMRAAMFDAPIHKVGLLFDAAEVRARVPQRREWESRRRRVVFTSRFDAEKQPHFFMDVVELMRQRHGNDAPLFAVCTSSPTLRSNDATAIERARAMERDGALVIEEALSKSAYYEVVADSQCHFNCALQDFVSNTLNEASALGTPSVLPAYLSFPEAVNNEARQMYVPWSVESAADTIERALSDPPLDAVAYPANTHDKTLDRVADILIRGSNEYQS